MKGSVCVCLLWKKEKKKNAKIEKNEKKRNRKVKKKKTK